MKKYVVLDKKIGQTPLECAEAWRVAQPPAYAALPLAYAGRLDPMASGKLLVLIGEECKQQTSYHGLDKQYEFSVLLGVASDTADVLGRLNGFKTVYHPDASTRRVRTVLEGLTGPVTLPYPHFSSKTVLGKPLHTWTLEGRLHEITIPTQTGSVYRLMLTNVETKTRAQITKEAFAKVNSIPPVTDTRKSLGNDFRRVDIRADWHDFSHTGEQTDQFTILHCTCICSTGTYMRSLAEEIGKRLSGTPSLAFHIHRTKIGSYQPITEQLGFWKKQYR